MRDDFTDRSFRKHMDAMALKMTGRPLLPLLSVIGNPTSFQSRAGDPNACPEDTSLKARQYQSPFLSYVTIPQSVPAGPAQADVLVPLPIPAKEIICVACLSAQDTDSLFMHFTPLFKAYGVATAILPTGNEQWLPFNNTGTWGGNTRRTGSGYRFSKGMPINSVYFDIGHESGGSSALTFVLGEDAIAYWKNLFSA
jgi:hypothetical protein